VPHIAAREAYLAVFHAAEAYIFEQTGKAAKTHRGVRSEFARLAKAEPRIGRSGSERARLSWRIVDFLWRRL
jgi:uncharacterized protein (UPF0332 family)